VNVVRSQKMNFQKNFLAYQELLPYFEVLRSHCFYNFKTEFFENYEKCSRFHKTVHFLLISQREAEFVLKNLIWGKFDFDEFLNQVQFQLK